MSDVSRRRLRSLLVDPALFTAPYDEALTAGLYAAGVETAWVTRPLRAAEPDTSGLPRRHELYYLGGATESVKRGGLHAKLRKGISHIAGAFRLLEHVRATRPDVVHLQWAVVPLVDRILIWSLRRLAPVIFTVHDLTPFNASASSRLQTVGFRGVLQAASALVVHTASAQETLIASGIAPDRVALIPHGPLRFGDFQPSPGAPWSAERRWRVVLFGKLQPYKGLDVLVEALGRLAPSVRASLEVIIAGEPLMDMEPLKQRIEQLELQSVFELRLGRLSDEEAHRLLDSADAFVFPYREIEASGVLYLVAAYRRWIIASDLGAFRDVVQNGGNGQRVASGDVEALAGAIQASIGRLPAPAQGQGLTSWREIGRSTRRLYERLAPGADPELAHPRTIAVLHDSPDFGGHEKAFLTWLPAVLASPKLNRLDFWIPEANAQLAQALEPFKGDRLRVVRHQFVKKGAEPLRAFTRVGYGLAARRFLAATAYDAVLMLQGRIENLATPMTWLPLSTPMISYVPMAHGAREMDKGGRLADVLDLVKKRLYGRPDRWIVPAEAVKAQLRRAGARAPVSVVENVAPTPSVGLGTAARPVESRNRVALFIGRFDAEQKGLDRLVEHLQTEPGALRGWTFVFVGAGPYAEVLQGLRGQKGLDVRVEGWTQDPMAYLNAADVLLMPSRFEGVPLVLLEAFRTGTPVLGSDIDVFREYLPPHAIFDFAQGGGLASALDRLVEPAALAAFREHSAAVDARLDLKRSQAAFVSALLDDLQDLQPGGSR